MSTFSGIGPYRENRELQQRIDDLTAQLNTIQK